MTSHTVVVLLSCVYYIKSHSTVPKNDKHVQKLLTLAMSAIFGYICHFGCLLGPLVAKLIHIHVGDVISFEMSGVTSKSVKN